MTTTRRRIRRTVLAAALLAPLSACGSDGGTTTPIAAATRIQLRHDTQALASAAAAHNLTAAHNALSTLNTDLAAAQAAGDLTDAKLAQIRAAALAVQSDLAALEPTPRVTVSITSTSTPTAPGPSKSKHGHGGGDGHGGD